MKKRLSTLAVFVVATSFGFAQDVLEHYELPLVLEETSGLAMLNDTLWTHNDSGNEATLYAISTKGKLLAKRTLEKKHQNIDWEDLTTADNRLVVADMGNNFGTRKNLYLLDIAFANGKASVVDSIPFHYPEQTDFSFNQATPFDAEGLIYIDGQLLLFSKNRKTKTTELYLLPRSSDENKAAKKIGSLPVGSLITGADFDPKSKTLVLTGYGSSYDQYLYVLRNFSLESIADVEISQHVLDFKGAQIEAVCIMDENQVWITSEKTRKHPTFLAKISI